MKFKQKKRYKYLPLVWLLLCFFLTTSSFAQKKKKIEILNANSLEFDNSKGKGAKRLIGDVAFKQGDVLMYCDSAYFFSKENRLKAYHNVHILQGDSLHIHGDSLDYNGNNKFAKLRGNIDLIDNNSTLTTNYLDYDLKNKFGYYVGGGKLVNKTEKSVLTSKVGYYYPDTEFFFFKDSVRLNHPDYSIASDTMKFNSETEISYFLGPTHILKDSSTIYCEKGLFNPKKDIFHFVKNASLSTKEQEIKADSIFYNKAKGYAELFECVEIIDTSNNMVIYGDYSFYNEKDSITIVSGNILLTQRFDNDTFYLHSDTLFSFYQENITEKDTLFNDTIASFTAIDSIMKLPLDTTRNNNKQRCISAYYHVRFYKNDMQGKCDSLVFSDADSLIYLFNNPILWADKNQMIADSINIKQYDGEIKWFELNQKAFISSMEDSTKFNQIKGKNMVGHFNKNELYKINVNENAQTIYYAKDDEKEGSYIGVNKAICNNMIIFVDSNEVKKITFLSQPDATLSPLSKINLSDMVLPDFLWKGHLQPKDKNDIYIWKED